jgi:hypothetical protein
MVMRLGVGLVPIAPAAALAAASLLLLLLLALSHQCLAGSREDPGWAGQVLGCSQASCLVASLLPTWIQSPQAEGQQHQQQAGVLLVAAEVVGAGTRWETRHRARNLASTNARSSVAAAAAVRLAQSPPQQQPQQQPAAPQQLWRWMLL